MKGLVCHCCIGITLCCVDNFKIENLALQRKECVWRFRINEELRCDHARGNSSSCFQEKKIGNWCFSSSELLENRLRQSSSGCPWDCLGVKSAAIKWGEVFLLQLSLEISKWDWGYSGYIYPRSCKVIRLFYFNALVADELSGSNLSYFEIKTIVEVCLHIWWDPGYNSNIIFLVMDAVSLAGLFAEQDSDAR